MSQSTTNTVWKIQHMPQNVPINVKALSPVQTVISSIKRTSSSRRGSAGVPMLADARQQASLSPHVSERANADEKAAL